MKTKSKVLVVVARRRSELRVTESGLSMRSTLFNAALLWSSTRGTRVFEYLNFLIFSGIEVFSFLAELAPLATLCLHILLHSADSSRNISTHCNLLLLGRVC